MSCPQSFSTTNASFSFINSTYSVDYEFDVESPAASSPHYVLLGIQWSICFIGILGNILVLLIYQRRLEKSPSEVFIVVMACLDVSMCSCTFFFTAFQKSLFPRNCFLFCVAGNFAFDAINTASSVLTFVICINRYFAVCSPHSYKLLFAAEKSLLITCLLLVLPLLNSPVGLFMCGKFYRALSLPCPCDRVLHVPPEVDVLKLLWVCIRTVMMLVNVLTMIYVYPKIFCNMRERSLRMRKLTSLPAMSSARFCNGVPATDRVTAHISLCILTQEACSSDTSAALKPEAVVGGGGISVQTEPKVDSKTSIKAHREKKLTATLLTVTIAYATLLTPDIVVHVIDTFALLESDEFRVIRTATQTLYLLNFVINPFIHYWVNSYFKSELQRRFLRCRHP